MLWYYKLGLQSNLPSNKSAPRAKNSFNKTIACLYKVSFITTCAYPLVEETCQATQDATRTALKPCAVLRNLNFQLQTSLFKFARNVVQTWFAKQQKQRMDGAKSSTNKLVGKSRITNKDIKQPCQPTCWYCLPLCKGKGKGITISLLVHAA